MFDEVKGKPVRGILTDVSFHRDLGNCTGILSSPDFCEGQEGRNELVQGRSIYTSTVESIDVVEGQLVIVTKFSAYIIEGSLSIWEEVLVQALAAQRETGEEM
jgi:hypothetical protein